MNEAPKFSPTEFIAVVNQTLEYSYSSVLLEGEVSSFKINQGKWVFFDLKDEESSISCFMSAFQLRMPLEDGMKVVVRGIPKLTKWGKFSLTVQAIQPVGEGSIKKSFELLKAKLEKEGLFDPAKKRPLPDNLSRIGVISSTQAAGYADFIKIINERWGGLKITTAHTQVQGLDAADQIIRALNYFNEHGDVEIIAIIRGGGSADDLSVFNDEKLVRAIAASKIPVITGIGHEVDESLSDLAADIKASTPSNVAQMLSHDRHAEIAKIESAISRTKQVILQNINTALRENRDKTSRIARDILAKITNFNNLIAQKIKLLEALNPEKVLRQGYAILSGKVSPGSVVKITTYEKEINAEIKEIHDRN
jgi:exodeoxyribonuclease VII large subunit